MTTLSKGAF